SGTGVTVGTVTVNSPTSISTSFTIAANAATGARSVTVTTPVGTSTGATFTINAVPVPTITLIQPNAGDVGTAVPVTITGTNFIVGNTTVQVTGTGVTVGAINVTGPTSLTTTFTI